MAPLIAAILPSIVEAGKSALSSIFPSQEDKAKREWAEQAFITQVLDRAQTMEVAAAGIVKAEAESGNWLTASWRPLTMLTFVTLIVARWMGYSAPGITEAEILKLWDIVQLGLGGYVIGRSAEKILPSLATALKR